LLWIHPFMDGNGRVARLIARHDAGSARHRRGVVRRARTCTPREPVQTTARQLRSLPPQ
jgi:hypothetical protein